MGILYIPQGEYELELMDTYHSYADDGQVGINDKGKNLTFIGENEKTKLIVLGEKCTKSCNSIFMCKNAKSVIRNMIIEFYPGKSDTNANTNAMFSHTYGNVYNVFFIIKDTGKSFEYGYNNRSYLNITVNNCAFYIENSGLLANSYAYKCGYGMTFNNIVSNCLPKQFTSMKNSIEVDIDTNLSNMKSNSKINEANAGLYYGDYAWN